ncbi:hypothetical protein C8Q77DRAFT_148828 [Trametes polyzona]|nr:hypothetical protein C8Q77DRAFT_148828 [Trametes polyzona]
MTSSHLAFASSLALYLCTSSHLTAFVIFSIVCIRSRFASVVYKTVYPMIIHRYEHNLPGTTVGHGTVCTTAISKDDCEAHTIR